MGFTLEWQNALYKATKGDCKIIPVRVDGTSLPPVLLQNVYIDLHTHGVEAAIVQIVNVIQGNNTFTRQHLGFSNLTFKVVGDAAKEITITISASHLMEPNPDFLILVGNRDGEVKIDLNGGQPHRGGFNQDVPLDSGEKVNVFAIAPLRWCNYPEVADDSETDTNANYFSGF